MQLIAAADRNIPLSTFSNSTSYFSSNVLPPSQSVTEETIELSALSAVLLAGVTGTISFLPCVLILLFALILFVPLLYLLELAKTKLSMVSVATPTIAMMIQAMSVPSSASPSPGPTIPLGFRRKFSDQLDGDNEGVCDVGAESSSTRTTKTWLNSEFPVPTMLDTRSSLFSSLKKVITSIISLDEGASPRNSIVPSKMISEPRVICLRFLTGS
mmetsp:Transcript_41996/g.73677  ORF Transcript_41996/g.73677 Transcript_41996/m.73677 type:complete len:214 (-) Transcript_41996:1194-1835(-)